MSTAVGSYDSAIFKELQYIPLSPWSEEVECLDILSRGKADEGFLTKIFRSSRSEQPINLVRQGSMLHAGLARDISAWREDQVALRKGLDQLKNPNRSVKPRVPGFKKEQLAAVQLLDCKCSKSFAASLEAGFSFTNNISAEESLTFTLDGLTAASVPTEKIIDWTDGVEGAWLPNTDRRGLIWSKESGSVNSIWIVTGVLYATKLTVGGRDGVFAGVNVKVPMAGGVPGLPNLGAGLNAQKEQDNQLIVKAPRNKSFRVGYRAMRLDYNPDGTPRKTVGLKYAGFRGEDDDLAQKHLKRMEEELFVVDEDGLVAAIPLPTPSEAELNELEALVEATKLQHVYYNSI
ncbi:hypothetical protein M758_8G142800 [Ceratodon purpureus]|nr:hypothetical protein M758_8G142800 [Ceratodon purpureus]